MMNGGKCPGEGNACIHVCIHVCIFNSINDLMGRVRKVKISHKPRARMMANRSRTPYMAHFPPPCMEWPNDWPATVQQSYEEIDKIGDI